jgi:hypothetical protein
MAFVLVKSAQVSRAISPIADEAPHRHACDAVDHGAVRRLPSPYLGAWPPTTRWCERRAIR